MRFFSDGPSIPDELLVARDEGRVVFFCGAGVSRAKAGLSDFLGLARTVADKLAVTPDGPTRELIAAFPNLPKIKGLGSLVSADRVFSLIEGEFETKHIYNAIATSLKPSLRVDLSAHRCLLDLARGPDGRTRLVTTNFDLLFEACDPTIERWKPPRLPDPLRNDEFRGIVHLHGHVTDDYTSAAGDGLIISSSEFGRAYLSERWATDFIRTVLEKYVVVFIGYAADDPPMQYLLEGLSRRTGATNEAYAFHPGSHEDGQARWVQKGVKAISYVESPDHAALWSTLEAWADRARSPDDWYEKIIDLSRSGPEPLMPHQRGQIAHVLSTLEGARRFSQAVPPPPASWLCSFDPLIRFSQPGRLGTFMERGDHFDPFDAYGLDSDPVPARIDSEDSYAKRDVPSEVWHCFSLTRQDRQNLRNDEFSGFRGHWSIHTPTLVRRLGLIGNWLARVSDQPAAVWWAARQTGIHPDIQQQIRHAVRVATHTSSAVRHAWRYLFDSWDTKRDDLDLYELIAFAKQEGWDAATIRQYATLQRPHIKVEKSFSDTPRAPDIDADVELSDLIYLDVEYPHSDEAASIPDDQISHLLRELRKNLELAIALENEIGGYGIDQIVSLQISTADSGSSRTSGISVPLLTYASLFRRLTEYDLKLAKSETRTWGAADPVFTRLSIWITGDKRIVSAKDAGNIFCRLSSEAFWHSGHQADLLTSLAARWSELPPRYRKAIGLRLLKGPPRRENENNADFVRHCASLTLTRVFWLISKGCKFDFNVDEKAEKLKKLAPQWTEEFVHHAIQQTRGGWVRTDTDSAELQDDVPLAKLLDKAARLKGRTADFLVERDPYAGLVANKPARALAAITYTEKHGKHYPWAWRTFLNSDKRAQDKLKQAAVIGMRLSRLTGKEFDDLIRPICGWMRSASKILLSGCRQAFEAVWMRAIHALEVGDEQGRSGLFRQAHKPRDWATEALNSPAGDLVQAILNDPDINTLKPASGLSAWWIGHVDDLLKLHGAPRLHVITLLSHHLVWFYSIDPSWTESHLVSAIERGGDEESAFWAGFFWGARIPQRELYLKLKSAMLRLANENILERREHTEKLAGILLAGWGTKSDATGERIISDAEMRSTLLKVDDDFRAQTISCLEDWSVADSQWSDEGLIFLTTVWPRQLAARTARVSSHLCNLAFSKDEKFPEYVDCVVPLVTTIDQDRIHLHITKRSKTNVVDRYPEKALELLSAVLPSDARKWPYGMDEILARIQNANAALKNNYRLMELTRIWNAR